MTVIFSTRYRSPSTAGVTFKEPSLTVQYEKDNTDVHNILERFIATGDLGYYGHGPASKPFYGDFSATPTFSAAMKMQAEAKQYFEALPSKIRLNFDNDYRKMVDFLSDPANAAAAREIGLLEKLPDTVVDTTEKLNQVVKNEPTTSQEANL